MWRPCVPRISDTLLGLLIFGFGVSAAAPVRAQATSQPDQPAATQPAQIERLLRLAPVIRGFDEQTRSFDVRGTVYYPKSDSGAGIGFRICGESPDRRALYLWRTEDQ